METSYYILENKKHPGWYKLGITNDLARRLSEHGEEWFRTVECLPVGARAEALAFETKVKQRYSSRSMRKGTEDFPLTFTEVESLRKELKAEHQRTRPKEKEGQQPVQVQPVKQEEGSEIDLDEFWSVVGALFLLVAVIGVPVGIANGIRQRQAEREAAAAFDSQALLFRWKDGSGCFKARQDARWTGRNQLCGPWAPGGWVNR